MSSVYNEKWNEFRDELLLRHLDFHSCYDNRRIGIDDIDKFDEILSKPGSLKSYGITSRDVQERYPMLYTRYHTWKMIIEYDGVAYDSTNNNIQATDHVWDDICKGNNFAAIYRRNGPELMWNELLGIFGPDEVRAARKAQFTPVKTSNYPPSVDYSIRYSSSEEEEEYISQEYETEVCQNTQERTIVTLISPEPPRIGQENPLAEARCGASGSVRIKPGSKFKSKRKLYI